jgi:uncharacterized protein (TIGR03435 family)
VLILAGACSETSGQSAPPQNQSFEVASIKVSKGTPQWKLAISGTRLIATSYTLFGLLQEAYTLQDYEIVGASPLLMSGDTLYDIAAEARGDGTPTRDDFRKMLQSLLADRFQMKVHRETKELPVYDLVIDKNGPKFKESAPGADPLAHFAAQGPNYVATMPKETIGDLANTLLRPVSGRPVLDKTGLQGTYDIKLTYGINRGAEPGPEVIGIFTAVQEQLGLRLVPRETAIEILVVDHVEKPSGN